PLRQRQVLVVAELGNGDALDQLHHKEGPAAGGRAGVEHLGDVGMLHQARAWRSASKRAMTWRLSMPGLMILRATCRCTGWICSGRKTLPMPPSPSGRTNLYGPITVPGPSTIG